MDKTSWEDFREYYSKTFNISCELVDLIAVSSILQLSSAGFSNASISIRLDCEADYVKEVLEEYLKFSGWDHDLDINPYYMYKNSTGFMDFMSKINTLSPITTSTLIEKAYKVCKLYLELRKEIDKFYDNETS